MKTLKEFLNEDFAKNVEFIDEIKNVNAIGWVNSKEFESQTGRYLYPADRSDSIEFGKNLKGVETLYRIETKGLENGAICKIDTINGTLSFIDDEEYTNEGNVVWQKAIKPKLIKLEK